MFCQKFKVDDTDVLRTRKVTLKLISLRLDQTVYCSFTNRAEKSVLPFYSKEEDTFTRRGYLNTVETSGATF